MLDETRIKQLQDLISSSTKEELIWINGYLAGLVSNGHSYGNVPAIELDRKDTDTVSKTVKKISLVYGTETGNAKRLAAHLAGEAKKKGVNAKLVGLDQYRLTDLSKEEYFFIVISTQGEGEPPAGAKKFYEQIHQRTASLANLKYSVLALGDTSYPLYCKTGEDVDAQLQKLGATRVVPLQKCDVDYEDDAENWFGQVIKIVNEPLVAQPASASTAKPVAKKPAGKKYYNGTILTNINLNDRGSSKQTYHIEITTDEVIEYEPGDTVGIVPRNRREVVERIITLTGADPLHILETTKVTAPIGELLTEHLNICFLMTSTIKKYAAIIQQEIPDTRMDLVDLLRIYPVKDATQFIEVVKILLPISPRLYSVASSPAAHGNNEVHITVARDRFLAQDEQRYGLCSEFLGDLPVNAGITFYVHKDKNFKLPALEKDVIMVGPGTGVAPFRAFLAERDATGATGRNWFFFGEQHFVTDFLYQAEIQNYVQTGVLNKIDLAFSRDQSNKIYVQHRMKEKAAELYQWINDGASFYISGTKDPMSKDVEQTLLEIIEEQGQHSKDGAKQYLEQLKKEGRYEKDVY
ncbi:MAG TPA: flavodoxin domain-containing protein [Chitinophagaceae bacterium]|jgi:sulfite reductase (NADPH) flavoprotein alpha-component|nr:flavodoxin domain-containing protein [Chitinophagaceae bacterium]